MTKEERLELSNLIFPDIKHDREYYESKYPERNLKESAMVTRFGPSPTGFVHMGSLFGAFTDSIFAKQTNGVFFLRIEDTDQKRSVENGIEGIFNDLEAFEITPDESSKTGGEYGPYIQSERNEIYHTFVKELIEEGLAYPCFMTEEEISSIREEQEINKQKIGIYGMYAQDRDLSLDEIKEKIKNKEEYVIRLKSPGDSNKEVEIIDLVKGKIKFPENDMDIVLLKKDKTPTYHLAHVIDDHLMRTTHVIRGDEWVSSIPLHIQLFELLNFKRPEYVHTAAITKKEDGNIRKLSKRKDPEAKVSYYDEVGIPIEAVKLYLATILNSNFEEWYLNNIDKTIDDFTFTFDKMAIGGTLFDLDKLNNISKTYFSRKSGEEVYNETLIWSEKHDKEYYKLLEENKSDMIKFLSIEKDGPRPRKDISKYSDVKEEFSYAIEELFKKENYSKLTSDKDYDIDLIEKYLEVLDLKDTNEKWFEKVKEFAVNNGYASSPKEYKKVPDLYKGHVGDICEILRVIVTGRTNSPDLFSILKILGKDRIKQRIELFRKYKENET